MKYFLSLIGLFILVGCQNMAPLPTTIELKNELGQSVGQAFAIASDQYLTVDHIFAVHEALFFADTPIELRQRDLRKDQLIFRLPIEVLPEVKIAHLAKAEPVAGETLYWFSGDGVVQSVNQDLSIRDRQYENLIVLRGRVEPGDSGAPVYNRRNQVVGLIVGGSETEVYLVTPSP